MSIPIPPVVKTIGVEEYINAFLVDKDVRKGMLIEPADYKERTEKDPVTKNIVRNIRAAFPSLKVVLTFGRQALLTKQRIRPEDLDDNEAIGKAIGYPCAEEFMFALLVKDKTPTTALNLMVKLFDNVDTDNHTFQLFANVCLSPAKQSIFEQMARDAEAAIRADPVLSPLVESVFVRVDTNLPLTSLLDKLVRGESFTEPEMEEFKNALFNLGFKEERLEQFTFSFSNPIHRGAGIALLSLYLHNPLEPFYPLQEYPGKDDEVNAATEKFEEQLFQSLGAAQLVAEGGVRRRRRTTTRRAKKN